MKHMANPMPIPPATQNFRTPQPSPIGAGFKGSFAGVCELSGSPRPGVPSVTLTSHQDAPADQ